MYVDALGPDRCRTDNCAPCAYYHLKFQALNGGREKLSPEQLEFVGVVSLLRHGSGTDGHRVHIGSSEGKGDP